MRIMRDGHSCLWIIAGVVVSHAVSAGINAHAWFFGYMATMAGCAASGFVAVLWIIFGWVGGRFAQPRFICIAFVFWLGLILACGGIAEFYEAGAPNGILLVLLFLLTAPFYGIACFVPLSAAISQALVAICVVGAASLISYAAAVVSRR